MDVATYLAGNSMNFSGLSDGVRGSVGIGFSSGVLLGAGRSSPQSLGINATLQDQILSRSDSTLARLCQSVLVSAPLSSSLSHCANLAN